MKTLYLLIAIYVALFGIKRQEATLRDFMHQQAAMLSGDTIINIQHDNKSISATVIAYKRVVV